MMRYNGLQIVESVYLTVPETRTAARSWRERWGSWPWRPWQATKQITVQVPSDQVYVTGGFALMHPVTALRFRDHVGGDPR